MQKQRNFAEIRTVNVSVGGRSNAGIFQDAVWNMVHDSFEFAVISWTSVPRYEIDLGLETYSTRQIFTPNVEVKEHRLNDVVYNERYLKKLNDRFTALAHPHHEILNLIFYINSLIKIAAFKNTKIFFVNALCPWDQGYFNKINNVLPNSYTSFTKKIINVDNRDDKEIFKIYDKIHGEYESAGGIQESYWLNLYQSLKSLQIDVNDDGIHPGIKSNQVYFQSLESALRDRL